MTWKVIGDIWLSDPHIAATMQVTACLVALGSLAILLERPDHGIGLVISTGSSSNGSPLSILKRRDWNFEAFSAAV